MNPKVTTALVAGWRSFWRRAFASRQSVRNITEKKRFVIEALEPRELLNASPIANDDTYSLLQGTAIEVDIG